MGAIIPYLSKNEVILHVRGVERLGILARLFLAGGAEVGASAAYDYSLDGGLADAAGLAGAGVDVVVELEEAGYAFGVYIIGDGGAA
jgi:hypothetical protein